MADLTYRRLAASILVAHQRRDSASCLCGWSELGKSHADHVAEVLDAAGALRDRPPPTAPRWVTCGQCGNQYDPARPRETHPYRHPPGGFRPAAPSPEGRTTMADLDAIRERWQHHGPSSGFIANARRDVGALLAEVERLQGGIRKSGECDSPLQAGSLDQPPRVIGPCGACSGCTVRRRTAALLNDRESHDG